MNHTVVKSLLCLIFFTPALALAHTNVGDASGLVHGLAHPVGGFDHLLAMVCVGLWAAQIGGKAIWVVPAAFVGTMVIGGLLGFSGLAVPFAEAGIVVSVIVLGLMVLGAVKLPLVASTLVVALFAACHGYAHGLEVPVAASALSYTLGFIVSTAVLHFAGVSMATLSSHIQLKTLTRIAGGAIALAGMYMAVA